MTLWHHILSLWYHFLLMRTSLLSSAAVAASPEPAHFLCRVFLDHVRRRCEARCTVRIPVCTTDRHGIGYHSVVWGVELSPGDIHLTVRVVQGDVDCWHGAGSPRGQPIRAVAVLWRTDKRERKFVLASNPEAHGTNGHYQLGHAPHFEKHCTSS